MRVGLLWRPSPSPSAEQDQREAAPRGRYPRVFQADRLEDLQQLGLGRAFVPFAVLAAIIASSVAAAASRSPAAKAAGKASCASMSSGRCAALRAGGKFCLVSGASSGQFKRGPRLFNLRIGLQARDQARPAPPRPRRPGPPATGARTRPAWPGRCRAPSRRSGRKMPAARSPSPPASTSSPIASSGAISCAGAAARLHRQLGQQLVEHCRSCDSLRAGVRSATGWPWNIA
jgi:hypothetical protein